MTQRWIGVAALMASMVTAVAHAQPVFQQEVLTDAAGRTVYVFDKDAPGKSQCTGGCLNAWPLFEAKAAAAAQGDFGVIETGGLRQWTYRGQPLYYFSGDAKPGDRAGDGSGGVWHVVRKGAAR